MVENLNYSKFKKGIDLLVKKIRNSKEKITDIMPIPRGGLVIAVYLSHALELPINLKKPKKTTLIVDDIADTGKTLSGFKNSLIATLYYKKTSKVKPTFWVYEAKEWIVFPWETSSEEKRDNTFEK